jgi:hypothetical protein
MGFLRRMRYASWMRQNSAHNRPLADTAYGLTPGRSPLHRHQQSTHFGYPLYIESPLLG